MAKIVLDDLTSIQNDPTAVDTINDNSALIEAAFENTLSRDGTGPNQMLANLDMNSRKILNLPAPRSPLEPARLKDIGDAFGYAEDAAASAAAAHADRLLADADVVLTHADVVLTHADVVLTHADVVLTHADVVTTTANAATATTQAGIATTQAGISTTQAGIATTQAGNAATSASTATTQAGIATTQAGNAATSASNASTSAGNAATSETNAAISAADALTTLTEFQDEYLGAHATDPTVDTSGNPLSSGDLYWNTVSNELRVYNGVSWVSYGPSVSSVFGRTGTVVATLNDYNFNQLAGNIAVAQMDNGTSASSGTYWRGDGTWASPAGGVTSVFSRTGAVTAQSGDYTVAQVTGAAPLASPALTGTPTAPTATALTNTTQVATTAFVTGATREKLSANRTYYVRTDGSDSNNGLTNTSGGAFLTIQKAWDTFLTIDLNGYVGTLQIGDGTYAGGLNVVSFPIGGLVTVNGNSGTPTNVVMGGVYVLAAGSLTIQNFRITNAFAGMQTAHPGALVTFGAGLSFVGSPSQAHIYVTAGRVLCGNAITIASSSRAWLEVVTGANFSAFVSTFTFSGTPAWSTGGILFQLGSSISLFNVTMNGAATGKRYEGALNATLQSFGAGTSSTYFPGSVVGTLATGAQQA